MVTVLFVDIVDFKTAITSLNPCQTLRLLSQILAIFEDMADKYDVFNIPTKLNTSYMFVAGLHDRSNMSSEHSESPGVGSLTSPFSC